LPAADVILIVTVAVSPRKAADGAVLRVMAVCGRDG
jgi:hypothetical protein